MAIVNGDYSSFAILSLVSSILTAAFISASITIEKDIDEESRFHTPEFYGLVNLKSVPKKCAVCALVLVIAACQLASKAVSVALSNIENRTILVTYLSVDVGIALALKVMRGDFFYWPPIESFPVRFGISFLARIVVKVITDFTACMQMRHPLELGGAYFTAVLLTTPFVSLYFGSRYLSYVEDDEEAKATLSSIYSSEQIYGVLVTLAGVQMCSFATFLYIIPSQYRQTFLSTETATQFTCRKFKSTSDDHLKMTFTFCGHQSTYAPIKEEVKDWINERLPVWLAEKPEWFDDSFKAMILDEYVEDKAILKKIRTKDIMAIRSARRRSSLGALQIS
eukprot:CAMPEP_0182490554 /NCGR_PEP_ID=MMETSP1321-20130603/376_1 /TAXON_ID=91990 /ORGANISM="Bolidomonas sp., Strain RCC1657" /LENGTH=336 /DNA_ID=CAMNT_0024692759 /DNA_START=1397 /DNA_END=2407 /DNA_ORIENTATION=-